MSNMKNKIDKIVNQLSQRVDLFHSFIKRLKESETAEKQSEIELLKEDNENLKTEINTIKETLDFLLENNL